MKNLILVQKKMQNILDISFHISRVQIDDFEIYWKKCEMMNLSSMTSQSWFFAFSFKSLLINSIHKFSHQWQLAFNDSCFNYISLTWKNAFYEIILKNSKFKKRSTASRTAQRSLSRIFRFSDMQLSHQK